MRKPSGYATRDDRKNRLRLPLMQAFREAAASGTSRQQPGGERTDTSDSAPIRSAPMRRRVSDEASLQRHLAIDLDHLLNTVNLASVADLDDYPAVRRSVVNFGMMDLSHLTTDSAEIGALAEDLRRVFLAHEPRLDPATLTVTQSGVDELMQQRVSLVVNAEMRCDPMNIPLDFIAEIDTGTGEVQVHNRALGGPAGRAPKAADLT